MRGALLRGGHEDDLPHIGQVLRDCVAQMRAGGIDQWDDVYPDEATLRSDLSNRALYVAEAPDLSNRALYVAEAPERPVAGLFVIDEHQEPEYAAVPWKIVDARVAVVHRLMVHPSQQRRGLGRDLMRFAEQRAHSLGYGAIRLDAFTGNEPSLRLYRGLGYDEVGGVRLRKGAFRCFEKGLAQ